jgi:hypothetical protein
VSNLGEDSLQHHSPLVNDVGQVVGHATYARCESCMWGSHYEVVTWHPWAGDEDMRLDDPEYNERVTKQKCHCDCAGPLDHNHLGGDAA